MFYGMIAFFCTLVMDRVLPHYEPILSGWFHELGCFVLIISVGMMTVREIVRQYRENALTEERVKTILSASRSHFDQMNEMYDTISILKHDYKYHLNTIGTLVNSEDIAGIKKYVTEIVTQSPEWKLTYYCKNAVINALLAGYEMRCEKEGIKFTVSLSLPKIKKIDDYELCVLFGNLLENAFTACLRINSGRYIEFSAMLRGDNFGITVKNSFNGKVLLRGDELLSTKVNGGNGIKSILSIVNRHGGDFVREWDENSFMALVVVNINSSVPNNK